MRIVFTIVTRFIQTTDHDDWLGNEGEVGLEAKENSTFNFRRHSGLIKFTEPVQLRCTGCAVGQFYVFSWAPKIDQSVSLCVSR